MKKAIIPIICLLILGISIYKSNDISDSLSNTIISSPKLNIPEKNEYAKEGELSNFGFVQLTDNFVPRSYQDLKNIVYTIINNGWESFTFYCPSEYEDCVSDMSLLGADKEVLNSINNFVHPYNSYIMFKSSVSSNGEITIIPEYLYTKEEISAIEKVVDKVIEGNPYLKTSSSKTEDVIKYFHDYIINNAKYDVIRAENGESEYKSQIAFGPLIEGKAICSGYSDAMAIFLNKLGIKNYKIDTPSVDEHKDLPFYRVLKALNLVPYSEEIQGHMWNAVQVNGEWLHLDLTWDDPVVSDGSDYLYYNFFLINTEKLKKQDQGQVLIEDHNFDDSVYLEFNPLTK